MYKCLTCDNDSFERAELATVYTVIDGQEMTEHGQEINIHKTTSVTCLTCDTEADEVLSDV
jgi:predicted nucleic-acid-binding Zn-ribbon protein